MQPIFEGSSYDTPLDTPRILTDRLFLNTRWVFVAGYVNEIVKARSLALKGKYDWEAWVKSSHNVFKVIEGCGGRIHLRGLEYLSSVKGPVVFISNHMSTLETFVFPCIIVPHKKITFVVKDSLVRHPLFGPVMRSRDPIVIGRSNPRADFQTVINEGKKILEGGTSIVIFPQSTRSVEFIPEEFNSIGIKLARAADVPVIPVAIKTNFWGNGRFLKDVGPVDRTQPVNMTFGRPFTIQGSGREEHKRVVDFIREYVQQWEGLPQ